MEQKEFYSWDDLPPIQDYRVVNEATEARDPRLLDKLSRHPQEQVRARVAENPNTPIEVLERLSKDSKFVQLYLVRNPVLPFNLLRQYMTIEDEVLKRRVYERMLQGYRDGLIELTGEEVYLLILFLEPKLDNLTRIELIEEFHQRYDRAKGKV